MPVLDYVYELRENHAPPRTFMNTQGTERPLDGAAQAVKFGFLQDCVTDAIGH